MIFLRIDKVITTQSQNLDLYVTSSYHKTLKCNHLGNTNSNAFENEIEKNDNAESVSNKSSNSFCHHILWFKV